jgi:hypothetical protein
MTSTPLFLLLVSTSFTRADITLPGLQTVRVVHIPRKTKTTGDAVDESRAAAAQAPARRHLAAQ